MNIHSARAAFGLRSWKTILGITVASIGWDEAIGLLKRMLAERRFTKVSFLNAHNANIAYRDPAFAAALDDFLMLPDGIGVDIAAKILYGSAFPANLNGTDFIPAFLQAVKQPLKVALIGARRENADGAAKALAALAPQHSYAVVHDGYFRPDEEGEILAAIKQTRPDVLLVAMGVPRQELWIAEKLTPAHCTLPIAVGALLDFLSGAVPRAPSLLRRLRFEWVFRLFLEPERLWRRYVLGNPAFLARVLKQKVAGPGEAG